MTESGQAQVEQIAGQDVCCPDCGYNLRGLHGAVVSCPECGRTCDIGKIVTKTWRGPWYKTPELHVVMLLVVWAVLAPLGLALCGEAMATLLPGAHARIQHTPIMPIVIWFIPVGVWMFLMWRTHERFGSMEGPGLALLSHFIPCGYLLGVVGLLSVLVGVLPHCPAGIRHRSCPTHWAVCCFAV